ncbi:hypothetical protein HKX48_001888 [Thoreauomyces humboldtii]|nr:hypothetical protein HKX48_001888 [Thoreauomyces humboldtii]
MQPGPGPQGNMVIAGISRSKQHNISVARNPPVREEVRAPGQFAILAAPKTGILYGNSLYEGKGSEVVVHTNIKFKLDDYTTEELDRRQIKKIVFAFPGSSAEAYIGVFLKEDLESPHIIAVAPAPDIQKFKNHLPPVFNPYTDTPATTRMEHLIARKVREARAGNLEKPPASMVTRSKASQQPEHDSNEELFRYPPKGKSSVSVRRQDYARLTEGEFLNDVVIEFGLKHVIGALLDPPPKPGAAEADSVHHFNTFFYEQLSMREPGAKKGDSISGYERVKKWTSKVDLFKKKYIFIPINENMHWYLALIYNPGALLMDNAGDAVETIAVDDDDEQPPQPFSASELQKLYERRVLEIDKALPLLPFPEMSEDASDHSESEPDLPSNRKRIRRKRRISVDPVVIQDLEQNSQPEASSFQPACIDISIDEPSIVEMTDAQAVDELTETKEPVDLFLSEDGDDYVPLVSSRPRRPGTKVEERGSPDPLIGHASAFAGLNIHEGDRPVTRALLRKDAQMVRPSPPRPAKRTRTPPVLNLLDEARKRQKDREKAEKKLEKETEELPDQLGRCQIFILDSLHGKHPSAVNRLKTYLASEAEAKLGVTIDPKVIRAISSQHAKVPLQTNHCDCGIYLIYYVEVFLRSPLKYLDLMLSKRSDDNAWFAVREVEKKRPELRQIMDTLAEVHAIEKKHAKDELARAKKAATNARNEPKPEKHAPLDRQNSHYTERKKKWLAEHP